MADTKIMNQQQITQLLLSVTTAEDFDKSVSETVRQLTEQAKASASNISDFLWDVWNAFFDAVAQTPSEKVSALVDVLVTLRSSEIEDEHGQPITHPDTNGKVWSDLPTFGWVARDLWNFDALHDHLTDDQLLKLERQSTFLANLTALSASQDPKDPLNFSLFALWALRTAFEESQGEATVGTTNAVRLAAPWISRSGSALANLSQEGKPFEGNAGAGGQKFAEKQWKGFNKQRWQVWKDGFVAAQNQVTTQGVKDVAKQAANIM